MATKKKTVKKVSKKKVPGRKAPRAPAAPNTINVTGDVAILHPKIKAKKGFRILRKNEIIKKGDYWGYTSDPNSGMVRAEGFIGHRVSYGAGDDFFVVREVKTRRK